MDDSLISLSLPSNDPNPIFANPSVHNTIYAPISPNMCIPASNAGPRAVALFSSVFSIFLIRLVFCMP